MVFLKQKMHKSGLAKYYLGNNKKKNSLTYFYLITLRIGTSHIVSTDQIKLYTSIETHFTQLRSICPR
ncbi:hypothetical protein OENI_130013 [Oenococcus oeni]|nr:hypothetical protein OENI_130013 [Oenococcus oeni]